MAGFAFDIEMCGLCAFILMGVVAGEAGHLAIGKTPAGGQHAVLISMYIYCLNWLCCILPKEVEQPVACLEGKGWPGDRKPTAMAKPAHVQTLLTCSFCRIKNGVAGFIVRILLVEGNVFQCGAMTFFAFDAEGKIYLREFVRFGIFVCCHLKIRGMTLQAPHSDRAVEIRLSRIAGADGPFIDLGEPGQWQFEKVIMEPVDTGLASLSRSHHDIEGSRELWNAI